jgi:hypothetical protein
MLSTGQILTIMYLIRCIINPVIGICLLVKSQKLINYFINIRIYSFSMVPLDFLCSLLFQTSLRYCICTCISHTFLTRIYPPKLGCGLYRFFFFFKKN